jgi:sec-independent protein translocase protein TatC
MPLRLRRRSRPADGRMTLVEHLAELRYRLVVSLLAVAAGAVAAFLAYSSILEVLLDPYCEILPPGRECNLVIRDPLEGFATRLRVAGWAGVVLASPIVLWQLWRFVTPGLHPKEKRYAVPFVLTSIVLFLAGGALALATFPRALDFLVTVGGPDIDTLFSPAPYLRLVILMIAAFGLAFELPVVLVFLQLAGVVTSRTLASWRRYAIVVVFLVAAVVTPSQDPWTLLALALPMALFYEGAILVGRVLKR